MQTATWINSTQRDTVAREEQFAADLRRQMLIKIAAAQKKPTGWAHELAARFAHLRAAGRAESSRINGRRAGFFAASWFEVKFIGHL
jgi:hypothetical protein